MSMLLVHELHEARDRVLLLQQVLRQARERELPAFRSFLDDEIAGLQRALDDARIPERYQVAIVGRFKVGKSSFVNKLAEERLAGVETSPETAAISVFRYADHPRAEVDLISAEEWDRLRDAHAENPDSADVNRYAGFVGFNTRSVPKDRQGNDRKREIADLKQLANTWIKPGGHTFPIVPESWGSNDSRAKFRREVKKFTSSQEPLHYLVNRLTIYAPIPILGDHIELIDTPGLDDTERFRVHLTEELVREVDAILFLTTSGAAYGQTDKEFLVRQLRRRQIKHLQIIVTKGDETFENAVRDARDNDEDPPSYEEYRAKEIARVRREISVTLDELLRSNNLNDEEGYYYLNQLENVPIHVISKKFHEDGQRERGGIDQVREGLYHILSTSYRFEQSKRILTDRLSECLNRLHERFSERVDAIGTDYDPDKVRAEIGVIQTLLQERLDFFVREAREQVELLGQDQASFEKTLSPYLQVADHLAREVLDENLRDDLIRHWRTRRAGNWGYLSDLQAKVADRVFPVVEARLNELRGHLDQFMERLGHRLQTMQAKVRQVEEAHRLSGLEPMALAEAQRPVFDDLGRRFTQLRETQRDGIVNHLEDFVSTEVTDRLHEARSTVTEIVGTGTTRRQTDSVQDFYGTVKRLLGQALREHLDGRIREFAAAILENAKSVAPRIREATLAMIEQRLQAIESTLAIASTEEKERITTYLREMRALTRDFAAIPAATTEAGSVLATSTTVTPDLNPAMGLDAQDDLAQCHGSPEARGEAVSTDATTQGATTDAAIPLSPLTALRPLGYEIADGDTGYTYERIFRPYLDDAETIVVEDPYIRKTYQVENFARFCALAIRLGAVKRIELVSGEAFGEDLDEADSRLENLRRDLHARGVALTYRRDPKIHDREVRLSNGWVVQIGRGLDLYHRPEQWGSIEASDFALRRCKQTRVEIFRRDPLEQLPPG